MELLYMNARKLTGIAIVAMVVLLWLWQPSSACRVYTDIRKLVLLQGIQS